MNTNQRFRMWWALSIFLIAIASSGPIEATIFTSTQSGSWGNAATWGGAGVPSCNDDAIISTGHTVMLDANRCAFNLTINSGATLDLAGFEMNYSGNNVTFTNNGTFTNSGSFNRLVSANGGANQTIAGTGTYSGNLKLENFSVNWNIAAGTTFTFNSATNNVNIQIENANLNLNGNNLVLIAPAAGPNYVIFDRQGGNVNGPGTIQTQGNVRIKTASEITLPVETLSGAAQGEGYFGQGWMVDSGASLTLSGTLTVSNLRGGTGLTIPSGATVDLAGNQLNIAWNGPFTNNGTVNNSGAFNRIVFMDNGVHALSGTGVYNGNVGIEAFNNTTNVTAGSSLTFGAPAGNTNIQVDAGANLNFLGPGSLTLSGQVLNNGNNGALRMNDGGTACDNATKILIRSGVSGTQRSWNGNAMSLINVDVKDQAGSATMNVSGSINSGNNGANWMFTSPCAGPSRLLNISTRLRVQTGDNRLIGGFIVTGTEPKKVILRAIGPSLSVQGVPVPGRLANPTLELYGPGGLIASNDNWRTTQEAEIIASMVPPTNDLESAIVATLPANNSAYTAVVQGVGNTSGIGLVEAYDLNQAALSQLANVSTRGFVETGDDVMIGGFIVGNGAGARVIVRAIGPSLTGAGVAAALADPMLEVRDSNGALVASNDDWRSTQEAEIIATTVPPTNDLEAATVGSMAPGAYTAVVRGKNGGTGVALVEAYNLQ